ncbi:MAG: hypothetical protein H0V44_02285 [Planctomycetes bacterium]|nr:hypothetical protein [Planctomycetota bacterium]
MIATRTLSTFASLLLPLAMAWCVDTSGATGHRDELAKIPGLIEKDGSFTWEDAAGAGVVISDFVDGRPMVEVAGVIIAVPPALIVSHPEAIKHLRTLAKVAKPAAVSGWSLDVSILAGPVLRGDKTVVVEDKLLKRIDIKLADRAKDLARLATAVQQFKAKLPGVGMNHDARKATEAVLDLMCQEDLAGATDEFTPDFARRVARTGWLTQIIKDSKCTDELKGAIVDAEKMTATLTFTDGTASLSEMRDAFGHGGWTLTLPNRVSYAVPHLEPLFLGSGAQRKRRFDLDLVVDLPAKSDPLTDADKATAARVYHKKRLLGSWDGKAFTADAKVWRDEVADTRMTHGAENTLPPHLVLSACNGDPRRLIVPAGVLIPAKDGSPSEVARFLGDAAKLLPDAGYVDLVGEYLYSYVYDSPDPRFPFLIGSKQLSGEIHQTADQTVANVAGGVMRGDCDDIAELYESICVKKGLHGHCALLPGHTAFVYAEKPDDSWRVTLLQTGPPMQFSAKALPDALRALYASFDQAAAVDPDGLGILLRFSGENTRGAWRLSWRIFAEPEYSKAMVDVQRDWQYQTYARGITTMKKMIDAGDKDPANYRELAGLANFTGQHALAVEYMQKAIDVTVDPVGKLQMNLEQVGHMHEAKLDDQARALALDILEKQIPATREQLGNGIAQICCGLAAQFNKLKAWDLSTRTLKEIQGPMNNAIMTLAGIAANPKFDPKTWEQLATVKSLVAAFHGVSLELITGVGIEEIQKDPAQAQLQKAGEVWTKHISFRDSDDVGEVLGQYAALGAMLKFRLGQDKLIERLESATFPATAKKDHYQRKDLEDEAQLESDLQWIKLSVPFWYGVMAQEFAIDKETVDTKQVKRFGRALVAAAAAQGKLGLDSAKTESLEQLGRVVLALVEKDAKTLRELLKAVAKENDKRLRDSTAQWLGDASRCLDDKWYGEVIQLWKEEINYKPKWFWVAWRAALSKAPQKALAVAKRAAAEFKDDPSFSEEYEFMRQILGPAVKASDAAPH